MNTGGQPHIFQGRGGFVELGISVNLSSKKQENGLPGFNFGAFSLKYS